jgi:hypothetical protein
MKISKSRLRRIIQEEVSLMLEAQGFEVEPDNNTILGKIGKKIGIIPRSQGVSGELFRMSGVSDKGLENSTEDVRNFAKAIGYIARINGHETPVVTSGQRSPEKQAEAMYKKWKGGHDLKKLYSSDCAECQVLAGGSKAAEAIIDQMIKLFKTREPAEAVREAGAYLEQISPQAISAHTLGKSLDFRNTEGIKQAINSLEGKANFTLIDETEGTFPHIHVHVKSFPNNVAKSLISQWKAKINPVTRALKKYASPDV